MSRLPFEDYLRHLRDESARFRAVLADCDPAGPVPTCPAWDVGDLLWHLTEVQRFWAAVVAQRPAAPSEEEGSGERPRSFDELLAAFDGASASLAAALETADPTDSAWTWAEEQTVGFIMRRQALEALVHRLDAEVAAGVEQFSEIDALLAADGVDEVLDVMYGGCPPWGTFSPLPHFLRVDLIDVDQEVWVQFGHFDGTDPDGVEHHQDDIHVVTDPGEEPDAVVSGTAAVMLARLWRRGPGDDIHLAGDLAIVDRFRSAIHHPIE
ncbi:MAG: maleylpyruvate isomerase N-terminal domain-containing protein [Nocardioidaceae bacterium]